MITLNIQTDSMEQLLKAASQLAQADTPAVTIESTASVRDIKAEKGFAERFHVDGDLVHDRNTGLTWSRGNAPGGTMNWAAAKEACAKLALSGFSDWRLPTIHELLTLVDYDKHNPSIAPAFTCDSAYYWSSTPAAYSPGGCAWFVGFGGGVAGWYGRGSGFFVRAVRASQGFDLWHVK